MNPFLAFARALGALSGKKARVRRAKRDDDGPERIIGVDGEGYDTPDGRHIYIYLAAVDEAGVLVADAYNPDGLSHDECCEMLLSLPRNALNFGFMFSYDVTKILEAMPPGDIFYLMRPQVRDETVCLTCKKVIEPDEPCEECGSRENIRNQTRAVTWRGRNYDYFNGSLTIGQKRKKTKIWDCFRFFGCAFVEAIKDWLLKPLKKSDPAWTEEWPYGEFVENGAPLCTREQVERIAAMKGKRGALEEEDPEEVKAYCREECVLLARMMRRVIQAHEKAGIPLKRFDGAGSTATALLKLNEVANYKGTRHRDLEPQLARAIASAFFGGRFEDDVVGIVEDPVYSFDISSAYPFAQTFLPCLTCGQWRFVEKTSLEELQKARLAVAAFRVRKVSERERKEIAWCPLPFRDAKGSIAYGTNFSGWAWTPELLAALAGWPELVELTGPAWIYETGCKHQPFQYVPQGYRRRVEWGKEGAGKAMKLGLNAGYGKTAQSIGDDPPFQCWTWAGATTGTTRGQLLDGICSAEDRWNVLTVATDGITSLEKLPIKHAPRATGTDDLPKPLGGWELKGEETGEPSFPEGMMIVKPGLYWRLNPTLSDIRARGIGRREAFSQRKRIQDDFLTWDRKPSCGCEECRKKDSKGKTRKSHYLAVDSRRFYGAKHSIYARSSCGTCGRSWPGVPEQGCRNENCKSYGQPGTDFRTSMIENDAGRPAYGLWGLREVRIGFDPHPKREREGISRKGTYARLCVRDLGGETSAPYKVGTGKTTPEGVLARNAREIAMEQPDYDPDL